MIKYQILKIERKPISTGKMKAETDLQDFNGAVETKVTLWKDSWPNFDTLKVGDEVMGDITVKQNGQYTNKTLNPERTTGYGNPGRQPSVGMNKIMEKKQEGIKESQERKENSIKLAATMRDATLLTVEWIKAKNLNPGEVDFPPSDEEIKKKWLEWRKWLDNQFGDNVPF